MFVFSYGDRCFILWDFRCCGAGRFGLLLNSHGGRDFVTGGFERFLQSHLT
jgi:hypothetical protein